MANADCVMISSTKEIANALNAQFTAFGLPCDTNYPVPPRSPSPLITNLLSSVHTTTFAVRKYLRQLKCCKSPGLDNVSNEVLRLLAPSIAYPLAIILIFPFALDCFRHLGSRLW